MSVINLIDKLYKQASTPYIGVRNGDPRVYPQYTDIYWDDASDSYRDYDGNEISADDVDEPSPVSVADILTPEQIAAYRRTQGHDQGVGSALILGTYGGAIAGGIGGNVLGKKLGTSIANKAEAIENPVGRLGVKALGKAPRVPLIGAGVLGGALLGSVPGIVHGVNHAKKNEKATVDKTLSADQIRLLNERSNLTYKSAMNATEIIDLLFEKVASTRWAREFVSASDRVLKSAPNSLEQRNAANTVNHIGQQMMIYPQTIRGKRPMTTAETVRFKSKGGDINRAYYKNWLTGNSNQPRLYSNQRTNALIKPKYKPLTDRQMVNTLQSPKLRKKITENRATERAALEAERAQRSSGDLDIILNSYKR